MRRILPAALVVLVLLAGGAWLLSGRTTVPAGSRALRLADGSELAAGTHLRPGGFGELALFPTDPDTLVFPPDDGSYRLFDSAEQPFAARFAVVYAARPGELASLHAAVGTGLRDTLDTRLRRAARPRAAGYAPDGDRAEQTRDLAGHLRERLSLPGLDVTVAPLGRARPRDDAPRDTGVDLLVVGIDAADWTILDPLLAAGRLPHLASLVDRGVRGDLVPLKPMLSPLLWTTLATGTTPDVHGILDFVTTDPATGKQIPVTRRMRRAPAFWNHLTQYNVSQGLVGWLATWPAEAVSGIEVTDRFGYLAFAAVGAESDEGMTWPADYAATARGLQVSVEDLPADFWRRFVDVPDAELAGLSDRGFAKGDVLGNLAETLATALTYTELAEDIRTRLDPRVLAVYYEMIDAVGHLVMPYAPPPREGVDPESIRRYGRTMEEAYVFQDELLGRLLDGVGPSTLVLLLSDHGFKSGDERLAVSAEITGGNAARWHRAPALFVLAGPGVREGARLARDPEMVDVLPTLLGVLGLPVPGDLPGRFLEEAFTPEGVARYRPERVAAVTFRPEVWRAPEGATSSSAAELSNLGLVLEKEGDVAGAEARFREAMAADPGFAAARTNLAGILIRTGRRAEARPLLERTLADDPDNLPGLFNLAWLDQIEGNLTAAEASNRRVLGIDPAHDRARVNLGHVLLRQGRLDEAETEFRTALDHAPDANAWFGLGIVAFQRGDLPGARDDFRRALEIDPTHRAAADNLRQVEGMLDGR